MGCIDQIIKRTLRCNRKRKIKRYKFSSNLFLGEMKIGSFGEEGVKNGRIEEEV